MFKRYVFEIMHGAFSVNFISQTTTKKNSVAAKNCKAQRGLVVDNWLVVLESPFIGVFKKKWN